MSIKSQVRRLGERVDDDEKHRVKGVLISIAFIIIVVSGAGLLGIDLGLLFFIVLVLLLIIAGFL